MVHRSFEKRKTRARPQPGRALRRPLSSFALPQRGARQTARSSERFPPQNRKTSKRPTPAVARGAGRLGQGHPEFLEKRSHPAPPPLPGPSTASRLGRPSAASASRGPPGRPGPARGSSPRGPSGPRSPEGFSEAAARRLEPHGPPPAPGQSRVSPAVVGRALARAGPHCACALWSGAAGSEENAEVDRSPGTARRRAAKPGADPHPRPRWPVGSGKSAPDSRGRDVLPLHFLWEK